MSVNSTETRFSLLGGILFSAVPNLGLNDFISTGLLAVFGAVVSFLVTLLLKWLIALIKGQD
ncbi:hypothetical protein [Neotamlana laminarinivorans]|uniref:Uncharacterized protein n=1 Tax=Neotamlana laminarinivorans TaxID=2883124 RepID=A0A9X1I329_9FLAO|nr:hypothetical protein [Tamlana laminarinivorans]MCB4800031.1 hypothetical protein [Tamlana laminarinivorans]MCB4800256.1 hypothetical protein [Tamlana laminarinivorans]